MQRPRSKRWGFGLGMAWVVTGWGIAPARGEPCPSTAVRLEGEPSVVASVAQHLQDRPVVLVESDLPECPLVRVQLSTKGDRIRVHIARLDRSATRVLRTAKTVAVWVESWAAPTMVWPTIPSSDEPASSDEPSFDSPSRKVTSATSTTASVSPPSLNAKASRAVVEVASKTEPLVGVGMYAEMAPLSGPAFGGSVQVDAPVGPLDGFGAVRLAYHTGDTSLETAGFGATDVELSVGIGKMVRLNSVWFAPRLAVGGAWLRVSPRDSIGYLNCSADMPCNLGDVGSDPAAPYNYFGLRVSLDATTGWHWADVWSVAVHTGLSYQPWSSDRGEAEPPLFPPSSSSTLLRLAPDLDGLTFRVGVGLRGALL